jgi:hypothetical protein
MLLKDTLSAGRDLGHLYERRAWRQFSGRSRERDRPIFKTTRFARWAAVEGFEPPCGGIETRPEGSRINNLPILRAEATSSSPSEFPKLAPKVTEVRPAA